ncbi:MAG: hypothetical protein OHK93_000220 [Ramalina farinacea]|uniref:Uncharacterized protein n=1 Tax=Ramalina farinacea TaxID=258253 RepID=A0AA43TN69_9LECA|nr:hypothetical protein [Ramalina farinacea]
MVLPPKPLHSSPVPPLHTPSSSSSLETSQQLQRVEMLHQQLKAEAQRAHDFLVKLRRGELEARTQAQLHAERRQRQRDEMERRSSSAEDREAAASGLCTCSCPHQPAVSSSHLRHHQQTYTSDANGMNLSSSGRENQGPPPLGLHSRVDEREVRDLEKRVRGLEGRVRGFEGLPPDREMALLEVERLRRELEMLAKKKGGFSEGCSPQEEFAAGLKHEENRAAGPRALQNGEHGRHTSRSAAVTMAKD